MMPLKQTMTPQKRLASRSASPVKKQATTPNKRKPQGSAEKNKKKLGNKLRELMETNIKLKSTNQNYKSDNKILLDVAVVSSFH